MIGCPKPQREENLELIEALFIEQGHCMLVFNKYGRCWGSECMHHIKSRGSGGDDVRGNLIRLCIHHHQMFHNGLIPKSVLYYAIGYYGEP